MNLRQAAFSPPPSQQTFRSPPPPPLPPAPTSAAGDRSGQLLNGRYRLTGMLAKTHSSCDLYQAEDLLRQRPCSIKMVRPGAETAVQPQRNFLREVEILSRLSHPNIAEARVFNHDEQGNPFLVIEALVGRSLDRLLAEQGPLALPHVLQIVRAIGSALQHAHDLGIVHGSLTLSSVFVHEERALPVGQPPKEVVKILDFELARALPGGAPSRCSAAEKAAPLGSATALPAAAPPGDRGEPDTLSDQCALAIIAYRLLTGRRPFAYENPSYLSALGGAREAEPLEELLPRLPRYVTRAIHAALARNKTNRHASITAFMRAFDELPLPEVLGDKTVHSFRPDLIAICRQDVASSEEAVPLPLDDQVSTRRYPTDYHVEGMRTPVPAVPLVVKKSLFGLRPRQRYAVLGAWALLFGIGTALSAPLERVFHSLAAPTAVRSAGPGAPTPLAETPATPAAIEQIPVLWTPEESSVEPPPAGSQVSAEPRASSPIPPLRPATPRTQPRTRPLTSAAPRVQPTPTRPLPAVTPESAGGIVPDAPPGTCSGMGDWTDMELGTSGSLY